ncbi:MAG: DUF3108 domain-containing protein [Pseudomonadota bacterium]
MKIAVHLARHRRLLALGGLSLLLHLLALAWIAPRVDLDPHQAAGTPIALRLQRAAPPPAAPPRPAAQPAGAPSPAASPDSAAAPPSSPALPPLRPLLPAPATPAADDGPATAASAPRPGAVPLQMPGRYLVRMPPSARLRYAMSRTRPGHAPSDAGEAQIVWEAEGGRYQLRVEGVLGLLESEGGGDDAGIAPSQASEHQDDGSDRITRFDRAAGRIESDSAAGAPLHLGSQDRASVLMQLAGMGLAQPEQMQDVIEIVVGGPGGARVTRFRVLGREELATAAGKLAAVRLAELTGTGGRRLELWLAPEHNWMPVQLRVTEADGTVANQVVTHIETAPAPPDKSM